MDKYLINYLLSELAQGKTEFRISTQTPDGSHWYIHPFNKGGETIDIYIDLDTNRIKTVSFNGETWDASEFQEIGEKYVKRLNGDIPVQGIQLTTA
jgi:uncharacterized NAD-dependent epimerase/dehydratase family protein